MKKSEIEEEFDEKAHAALIKGLHKLDGKNEKSGREKVVRLNSEAIPSVNTKSFLKKIGNEFLVDAPKELSSLPKPLEKPAAKRLKRATGYEEVAIDVNKWESIVNQRRKAEQLTFPLHQADVRVVTSEKNFKPSMKSNLEKEVYALLSGAKLQDEKQETEEEQEVQKAMSLKEIRLRSKEIWKARILRQRIEKKAALLNKSKSRKYHRILRRERLRRQKENFERLRHVDPKSALEILNQIEKERINERMSLRHKKSKWLETQRTRAGQDPEARSALQQNAEIRNDLLEKLKKCEKEQDDDEGILQEQEELIKKGVLDPANAWVSQMARASKDEDEDGSQDLGFLKMKNFWEDVHQRKVVEKEAQKVVEELEKKAKKKKQRVEEKKVEKLKEEEFGGGSSEENSTKTVQEQPPQKKMQTQLKCGPEKNTKKDTKKKKTNETDDSRSRKIDEEKMNKDDEDDQEPLEKIVETIQEANIDSVSKKNKKADKNKREIEKIKTREERETEEPQRKKVEGIQANKEDKLKKKKAIGKDNNLKIEENKINVDFNGNKKNKKTKTGKKTETKKKSAKKAKKSQTEEEGKQQKKKPGKEKKSSKLKEKSGLVDQVFIDDMFDRAEEKLIKKLGEKATTHLQSREQPDPSQEEELPENINSRDDNLEFDFTVHGNENQIDEGLTRVTTLEDMDSLPAPADSQDKLLSKVTTEVAQDSKEMEQPVSIVNVQDGDILKIKSRRLGRSIPDYSHLSRTQPHEDSEEELLEDDLQDLFEEEENIKEFRAEKEAQEESSKLKDVDTFLEGWGGWAGPGIVPSERKKEKFRIKAPKKGPNKYSTVGNVIYNEKTDVHDKIRKVMVNQLPHPFSRVKDFEASIRQPLGRKFVPETVHRKLIAPPVTQKMGVVIAPMDEDVLLKNHQKRKKAVSKIEAKIDEKLKHINGLQENKRSSQTKFKRKKSGRQTLKNLVVHK